MYDITDFAKSHPGGAQLLALAVGRDATILFESHHVRPEVTAKMLKTLPKVETDINLCPDEVGLPAQVESSGLSVEAVGGLWEGSCVAVWRQWTHSSGPTADPQPQPPPIPDTTPAVRRQWTHSLQPHGFNP